MNKPSDPLSGGFISEVPSLWAQDPEVRARLGEHIARLHTIAPPIAEDEAPADWLARVRHHLEHVGEAPAEPAAENVVDLSSRRPAQAHRIRPLGEPWVQLCARSAEEPQTLAAPKIKGSNLAFAISIKGEEIIIDVQAKRTQNGPQPKEYAGHTDYLLVFGDETDDARSWPCPLVFDANAHAEARMPNVPEIRALLGRARLCLVEGNII